ncbi:MAG: hypothetical protein KDK25_09345 [Leptospiraceae bacterium]|nr:hypothetical protein [Leptospiraceae bacterium]
MQKAWQAKALILPVLWAGLILLLEPVTRSSQWPPAIRYLFFSSEFAALKDIGGYAGKSLLILLFLGGIYSFRVVSVAARFPTLALATLLLGYGLLSGGGTFFSDDALRHEVDGAYIARNLPLYCMSPDELGLPQGFERKPNHSHLATIYPPGTQWISYMGALGPGYRTVFNLLFALLSVSMMWPVFRYRSGGDGDGGTGNDPKGSMRSREGALRGPSVPTGIGRALLFHPIWMILFYSGHTDVLALLLCLNVALLLRRSSQRLRSGFAELPGSDGSVSVERLRRDGSVSGPLPRSDRSFSVEPPRGCWSGPAGSAVFTPWFGSGTTSIGLFQALLAGLLWAFACSIKPEAFLSGLLFLSYFFYAGGGRSRAGAGRRILVTGSFTASGILLVSVPLLWFSLGRLFHLESWNEIAQFSTSEGSSLELECFFYTTKIFSDYFISYRPDAVWLAGRESISSAEAIALVRMIWLPAWVVLGLGLVLSGFRSSFLARMDPTGGSGTNRDPCKPGASSPWGASVAAEAFRNLFLFLLSGYFLYRGSWQPWYFLWFVLALPGLWDFRAWPKSPDFHGDCSRSKGGPGTSRAEPGQTRSQKDPKFGRYTNLSLRRAFFLSLPILFYLPVVDYRVDGSFDLSFFYSSLLLVLALRLIYNRREH